MVQRKIASRTCTSHKVRGGSLAKGFLLTSANFNPSSSITLSSCSFLDDGRCVWAHLFPRKGLRWEFPLN